MDELTRSDWEQIERAVDALVFKQLAKSRWGGAPKRYRDLLAKVRVHLETAHDGRTRPTDEETTVTTTPTDAQVLAFLNAMNPKAATENIADWGDETISRTRAALHAAFNAS